MDDSVKELNRFQKSFLLHSARYNLYSQETLEKGAVGRHNRAVTAMGNLTDRVKNNPLLYSDLLLKWLEDSDPKVRLCAGFTCLHANIHGESAIDTLKSIAQNTSGISMICTFDISCSINKFQKQQMSAKPRNEVDAIAEKMSVFNGEKAYADTEIFEMVMKLSHVDMCGHDGRTTLIHACISNRFELVKKLVECGADVNVKDLYQKNALHCATIVGNIEIVAFLLNRQVNVNEPTNGGWTALDLAKTNASGLSQDRVDRLIELLRSYGGKPQKDILAT